MVKIKPKDIIAGVVILSFVLLRWLRIDGGLDAAVGLILGYYFVKRENGSDNGH